MFALSAGCASRYAGAREQAVAARCALAGSPACGGLGRSMSAQEIILAHDLWRKGAGGAPAGLAGQTDGNAYAGLDLGLAQFADSTFTGSSFTETKFNEAQWSACHFSNCIFSACSFDSITIMGCTFVNCTFEKARFRLGNISGSRLTDCKLNEVNFEQGSWSALKMHGCTGRSVRARGLRGEQVDFLGSNFEQLEFEDTVLNSTM
ncbi:pentapeptide repeat-containing protein [Variovorax sp. Varisp85]